MPRRARKKSNSGIYHIIIRGINRQNIFEDEEDNQNFIHALRHYKEISGYEVYAYCLMGNHVHLLLKIVNEPLEQVMRRICGSYVYWYNRKYERIGNLFQDRFKSEPVEDDAYFLTVLRYIHQNPYKAGLVKNIANYDWSSYGEYVSENMNKSALVDVHFLLNIFNEDKKKAVKQFVDFHGELQEDNCMDIEDNFRITDQEAREIIKKLCNIRSAPELQKMNKQQRNSYIKQLKEEYSMSIRQIERLTGINRGIIYNA
ncbi:MAG: transposase [Bacillota bacterium]|nr:transposase [Bacillota bacterium]